MPGSLSNYTEPKLLDHLLGTVSFSMPSAVHLALFTTAPNDVSGGVEVLGNGYLRQQALWNSATSTGATNSNTITFTASGGSMGTIVAIGIFDSGNPGAGNLLIYGALSSPRNMANGNVLTFAPGSISVALD